MDTENNKESMGTTIAMIGIIGTIIAGMSMGTDPANANNKPNNIPHSSVQVQTESPNYTYVSNTDVYVDDNYNTLWNYMDADVINYIYNVSYEYGVPPELTFAICYMESSYNPWVDNAGMNTDGSVDYGMMGLNSTYLQSFCDMYNNGYMIDPYNVYDNVHIGVQVLANLYNYWGGSIYDTACSYNLGIGGWESIKYSGGSWYYGDEVLDYVYSFDTLK